MERLRAIDLRCLAFQLADQLFKFLGALFERLGKFAPLRG